MSFWDLNEGGSATSDGSFESSGGDLTPIPNKTGCVAAIEEAKWDDYEGDRFINLKWRVAKPAEYGNRVIFQKIRVFDAKPEKADKAKRMLAAIDTNAGGKLMKIGKEPEDTDLMSALMGKMMAIKVMVWEIKEEDKRGNWISAVAPAGKQKPPAEPKKEPEFDDYEDDIPF